MNLNASRIQLAAVLLGSLVVALVSALPYAGGWNDGTRLAAVESLVDYGTLAIDQSVFIDPARAKGAPTTPYLRQDSLLMELGSLDKVRVAGHYYSDKPMVPAVLMAVGYQLLQWTTGLAARTRPDRFVYAMTLMSSGLAYVVAVLCIHLAGRRFFPDGYRALGVTLSFALGTVALTYSRQVNSHEGLLAVAAALMVGLHELALRVTRGDPASGLLIVLGMLTGLGYSLDFAAGPLLLVTVLPLVAGRCHALGRRGWSMVAVFLLAALPFIALHHLINFTIGGTFVPVNTVPEYLAWPGSPFDSTTATGGWHHRGILRGVTYALELLFGKKGFLLYQPVLILALVGGIRVMMEQRGRLREWPEMLFAFAWSGLTWLVYAWGSTNYSGVCASVRWFVPLLAPAYYALLVVLRTWPDRYGEFLALTAGGMVISTLSWWAGPWMPHMVPGYWLILAATLLGWGVAVYRRQSDGRQNSG